MTLRYGLYLGGFLTVYGIIFRLLNLPFDSPLGWVFYAALPVFAGAALLAKRRGGTLSYLEGALTTAGLTILGGVIYSIYVFGFNAFVDDTLILAVRETALADLTARGLDASGEAARRQFIDLTTTPLGFAITIAIQMAVAGLVISLIEPVFFRRR